MTGIAPILAQAAEAPESLSAGGAVIMCLSVSLVLGLNIFCFWRILREPEPAAHHHVPLEIDTHDLDT
jgi:hypothetical protein